MVQLLLVVLATADVSKGISAAVDQDALMVITANTLVQQIQPSRSMVQAGTGSSAGDAGKMSAAEPLAESLLSMSQQHATLVSTTLDSLGSRPISSSSRSSSRSSSGGRSLQAVLQGGDIPVTRYARAVVVKDPRPCSLQCYLQCRLTDAQRMGLLAPRKAMLQGSCCLPVTGASGWFPDICAFIYSPNIPYQPACSNWVRITLDSVTRKLQQASDCTALSNILSPYYSIWPQFTGKSQLFVGA
jgi:hypothetical protein